MENNLLPKHLLRFSFAVLLLISFQPERVQTQPSQDVLLFTPYTSRSVTPGETITYGIELYNNTDIVQNVTLDVNDLPRSWNPVFSSNSNVIQKIAVKPRSLGNGTASQNIVLTLDVPLSSRKGLYNLVIQARTTNNFIYELPLSVRVTEQGTLETEFIVEQTNMEGYSDSQLIYQAELYNKTAQEQNYSLTADAPPGWDVRFMYGSGYATSVTLQSNQRTENFSIRLTPPQTVKADTFNIKVNARSRNSSASRDLEAVIKGQYEMNFTTQDSRLNTEVTVGGSRNLQLMLQNTGTVPIRNIQFSSRTPVGWNIQFENKQLSMIAPGNSATVTATIQTSDNAIAGDYEVQFKADTENLASLLDIRVTVKSSITWGLVGGLIIVSVIIGIAYLFRTFGRR